MPATGRPPTPPPPPPGGVPEHEGRSGWWWTAVAIVVIAAIAIIGIVIANAGDAEIKGFEVESVFRPVRGASIDASYSYTDFEYTSLNNVGGIQASFVPPFMPKHKASIGAQYEWRLANGSSLVPRADWSFQSFIFTNGNNQVTNRIGGHGLVNARVVWRNAAGDLDIGLEGTNLGDKYYFLARADQYTGAGHTDGAPGRPREWAVTIKKRF